MACLGLCVFSSALRGKLVRGFKTTTLRRIFLTHMLSENIFSFWAEKLGVLAKKYRHGCQNCNLRTSKNFWGKTVFFFKIELDCKLLRTSRWKKRAFSQKLSFRVLTTGIRASREMSRGKMKSLSPKFYFSVIIFGVWVISLSFLQSSFVRRVKQPINVRREIKWGN